MSEAMANIDEIAVELSHSDGKTSCSLDRIEEASSINFKRCVEYVREDVKARAEVYFRMCF